MRYLLAVLVLAAMAAMPAVALAGGLGGACAFSGATVTAQQDTTSKQKAKTAQADRGDKQILVSQKTK